MYHTKAVKGGCYIRPVLFCGDISKPIEDSLTALGYRVFRLPPSSTLQAPVRNHPDMLMARLPSGKLLLSRPYYLENEAVLSQYRAYFELTDDRLGANYPDDVRLNAFSANGILFSGKTVSASLAAQYKKVITVKQGYAHCAACRIGQGIVTADPSLYRALSSEGIDTLLIRSGHIALSPYDTGFIGGASLTLSETLTAFFGNIEAHPDYDNIHALADRQGAKLLSLSSEPLLDYGGGYLIHDEIT